jgi:2'-5' RNA ligase
MVQPFARGARRAITVSENVAGPASPPHFRLFIALRVPDAIKDRLERAQAQLRGAVPAKAARWTRREQFHLTLKFLGNVAVERIDELTAAARVACGSNPPLRLAAQAIGFFPHARQPRVVWVGVRDREDRLEPIWKTIQSAAQPFTKEPPEPKFTGHVTVARVNRLTRTEAEALASAARKFEEALFGEWTANELELMRSELSAEGARHCVLAELPFRRLTS